MKDRKTIIPELDLQEIIKPNCVGQKCPVCNGWGTVSFKKIICHACGGKGYIVIPIEIERKKEHGSQD